MSVSAVRAELVALSIVLFICGAPARAGETAPGRDTRPQAAGNTARGGHLTVRGTSFYRGNGRFEWRGISAFRLVEMVARRREQEAIAFLDWARGAGLTVVRTFVMARHLFQLAPADGVRALPRLLELARDRELHVEVVALVDTAAVPVDFAAHVRAVGEISARFPNAILELANEPGHSTQDRRLHDPAFLTQLTGVLPESVPVALGSAEYSPVFARGDYATFHFPRAPGVDGWQHVLALARGAKMAEEWRKPVINDEPIGAAAALATGRRDNDPRRFRAAAALTRLAGMGATFHYEGGLHARRPVRAEAACFDAWMAGLRMIEGLPEGGRFLDGPAAGGLADVRGARAVFAREFSHAVWLLALDPAPDASVTWRGEWRAGEGAAGDGVRLFRASRRSD